MAQMGVLNGGVSVYRRASDAWRPGSARLWCRFHCLAGPTPAAGGRSTRRHRANGSHDSGIRSADRPAGDRPMTEENIEPDQRRIVIPEHTAKALERRVEGTESRPSTSMRPSLSSNYCGNSAGIRITQRVKRLGLKPAPRDRLMRRSKVASSPWAICRRRECGHDPLRPLIDATGPLVLG